MAVTWIGTGRFAAAAPSFAPTDIANCILWLDASHAASFTFSSGSVVSQWSDRSGGARHMVSGGTNQPSRSGTMNSLPTVVFDGTDDYMEYDAGSDVIDVSPWSFFAVVKDTSGNSSERILTSRQSATGSADFESPNAIYGTRNSGAFFNAYAAGTTGTNQTLSASTAYVVRSTLNGSNSVQVAVNAVTTTAAAAAAPANQRYLRLAQVSGSTSNPPVTFGTDGWHGEIAEVVLYNSALSGSDITTVETYLATKWGITL
jgi:hypothetical protein